MLTWTEADVHLALANLSMTDKQQLLTLLQERERLEAERPPDSRPLLDELFLPDASHAEDTWYQVVDGHFHRLESERPWPAGHQSLGVKDSLDQMRAHFVSLLAQAEALARADGHEDPRDAPRKVEAEPDDDLDRLRRAVTRRDGPIPRRDLLDAVVANTQEQEQYRKEQERAELAAKAEQEKDEKLSWFRDPDGGARQPSYPDS
jgi:hypothetical protein